jgi:hypothetical protein
VVGFVVVVWGGGRRSNRALTSFVPDEAVNEHERSVPAAAQRPPQPAKREPAFGTAVSVTFSPANG